MTDHSRSGPPPQAQGPGEGTTLGAPPPPAAAATSGDNAQSRVTAAAESPASKRQLWAYAPVLLLGGLLCIQAVLVTLAVNDPGFAVEADYYRKGVDWEQAQAQRAHNSELGFAIEAQAIPAAEGWELLISAQDRAGVAIVDGRITVETFAIARAGDVQQIVLAAQGQGVYRGPFRVTRPGLWELRIRLEHKGQLYTETQRIEIPPPVANYSPTRESPTEATQ